MIAFEKRSDCDYRYDYTQIFKDIAQGKLPALDTYRHLILNDLFFIVYFVMEVKPANHPFVVEACKDVENGPSDYTLDTWAREHYKSTILTTAETIQRHCRDSSLCIGIFSHTRPIAKGFLRAVKATYQNSTLLKQCFPETFWEDPEKQAPKWSEDDGLVLKNHGSRREASLEAWGLMEGMPTSKHFDHRVYDDVETDDIVQNPDSVKKLRYRFNLSQNLGTATGTHRVVGTYYSHEGLLTYLRDLKDVNGKLVYTTRSKPATHDGTPSGNPVLLSQDRIDKLKADEYSFNCQQLLNPTPTGVRKLDGSLFRIIDPKTIPKHLHKFMIIDQAGDDKNGKGDAWAIGTFGVDPSKDDVGSSNVYLLDAIISPLRQEEAMQEIVRMYLRNGLIQCVAVEKVGLSSTEVHIAAALKAKGRFISVDNKSLYLLKPAGRNKVKRIESALAWPLFNSKLHISSNVSAVYIERLQREADQFPFWHDDCLDMFSYLYDILADPAFKVIDVSRWKKPLATPDYGIV